LTTWGGIVDPVPLSIGEKRVIASVVQSNKNTVSSRVDIVSEEDLREATNYEQVYIISIEIE
jgi:hypothetical protein